MNASLARNLGYINPYGHVYDSVPTFPHFKDGIYEDKDED